MSTFTTARLDKLDTLTPRQLKVLSLMSQGDYDSEIATALGISRSTVKTHVRAVLSKLEVRSRIQAAIIYLDRYNKVEAVPETGGLSELERTTLYFQMFVQLPKRGRRFISKMVKEQVAQHKADQPTLSDRALDSVGADTEAPTEANHALTL